MGERVDDAALDILFRTARSHMAWQPRPVTDETLRELYELLKWAPTSANASPARFAFLRSKEAKRAREDDDLAGAGDHHSIVTPPWDRRAAR